VQRDRICAQLLAGENQHDGSLWLAAHGDQTCVPALMRVLQDNRPDPDSGISVCTYDHAVAALKKSSGDYADRTYKEWVEWYASYEEKSSD
jgi:hypothetical protein